MLWHPSLRSLQPCSIYPSLGPGHFLRAAMSEGLARNTNRAYVHVHSSLLGCKFFWTSRNDSARLCNRTLLWLLWLLWWLLLLLLLLMMGLLWLLLWLLWLFWTTLQRMSMASCGTCSRARCTNLLGQCLCTDPYPPRHQVQELGHLMRLPAGLGWPRTASKLNFVQCPNSR